jgi:hypothetical protein
MLLFFEVKGIIPCDFLPASSLQTSNNMSSILKALRSKHVHTYASGLIASLFGITFTRYSQRDKESLERKLRSEKDEPL